MEQNSAIDMTHGKPAKLIFSFAVPLLLGNLFQQLYNMVDSIIVGQFVGSTALAAVGASFPVVFLLFSLFLGIGIAAMILISQYYGAGEVKQVQDVVDTLYTTFIVSALPLAIIGILISKPIIRIMAVPADTVDQCWIYMVIVMGGMIGSFGYNANAGILQGLGDSKTPLLFLIISSVINVVLDLLFVIVFKWGVAGVAIATVIAQICSWIFGIFYINKKFPQVHIRPLEFRFNKVLFKKILQVGIPTAAEQAMFSIGIMALQRLINGYGSAFMAGYNSAGKLDTFMFMPIQSFATAATTFVGQNIGANKLDRVRRGSIDTMLLCCGTSIALAVLLLPIGRYCLQLFTPDAEVIEFGYAYLMRVLPFYWLQAIMFVFSSIMRGAGEVRVPIIATICALWFARLPAAYLFAHFFQPVDIYFCYAVGWTAGILISGPYFLSGRWKKNSLIATPATKESELPQEGETLN